MENTDLKRLRYRRQYIIAPKEIECPFLHQRVQLNNKYILYHHLDIKITNHVKNDTKITLIGDMFGYDQDVKNNYEILRDLISSSFDIVIERTAQYSGRYVIIFQQGEEIKLLHDNTASRKVYYADIDGSLWFASQPHLLAKVLNLQETRIPSKIDFYNSEDFIKLNNSNIGNTTLYDEIFQLLPNHYFDVKNAKTVRYWPNMPIESLDVDEAAEKCAKIIMGYMENICARYDVMLPVTAGKDSRILLAATRNIKDKVYYYVNKENRLNDKSQDISIPKSILSKLGIDFHIIDPYTTINEGFKEVYFSNNSLASPKYLYIIHNYFLKFPDKVNLPGNIASQAYYRYKYPDFIISPVSLAELNRISKYDFAIEYYAKWLSDIQDICNKTNVHLLNLFYWEERLANWGTQVQLDKDIAQEEINPYNSRLLASLFLSVNYKLLLPPDYVFYKKIINKLWPEVLKEPINPSLKSEVKKIIEKIGLLKTLYKIKRRYYP